VLRSGNFSIRNSADIQPFNPFCGTIRFSSHPIMRRFLPPAGENRDPESGSIEPNDKENQSERFLDDD